jgi:2-polyprenyl-3-methyl-5-hydroxy-6-metoxy-1,4-benzoquinol methylase
LKHHPAFGPSAPEKGWVPGLRYSLRRDRVLALMARLPRGRLLEVGCGAGALLLELAELGFSCAALETSPEARALAVYLNRERPDVAIHCEPRPHWTERFDVLVSLEVLEHIADDTAALAQWREWLRPGGRLLLSVPARPNLWSASDIWVGHYRRYERDALLRLLHRTGFAVEHAECYGFPLSNLTEAVRARIHGRRLRAVSAAKDAVNLASRTARSGTERSFETKLYPLQESWAGTRLFRACCRVQERFLDRELGTGYLLLALRQ